MKPDRMRDDLQFLSSWARALDAHHGHEIVIQLFMVAAARHALDHGFTLAGVAGAMRLAAERVAEANGAASITEVLRLAKVGADAEAVGKS